MRLSSYTLATFPDVANRRSLPSPSSSACDAPATASDGSAAASTHEAGPFQHNWRLSIRDRPKVRSYRGRQRSTRQKDIALPYGTEGDPVSNAVNPEEHNVENYFEVGPANIHSSKVRSPKFPEIEQGMLEYLHDWSRNGIHIRDSLIRDCALDIAKSYGIPLNRFKGSPGWIEKFKHRHGIRRGEWPQAEQRAARIILTTTPLNDLPSESPSLQGEPIDSCGLSTPYQQTENYIGPLFEGRARLSHLHTTVGQSSLNSDVDQENVLIKSVSIHQEGRHGNEPSGMQPTLEEAELALNTVIAFIVNCDQELLDDEGMDILRNTKFALFQYALGIPFERSYC